jgi:hypothetical protein
MEESILDLNGTIKTLERNQEKNANEIEIKLKVLKKCIENTSEEKREEYLQFYNSIISKIKAHLLQNYKDNGKISTLYNGIFKSLKISDKMPTNITKMFGELIRGITYFHNQIDKRNPSPIYHRILSCGPGDTHYRKDNHICIKTNTNKERQTKRPMIERCYIERLIYDELYKYEMPINQDTGHLYRLDLTREDYETCFKYMKLVVEIQYHDNYPSGIIIHRYKHKKIYSTEIYEKYVRFDKFGMKYYEEPVECRRILPNGKMYEKTQNFYTEYKWKR